VDVFDGGPDPKVLNTKIGELTLENDFLESALTKAGLLSAKRLSTVMTSSLLCGMPDTGTGALDGLLSTLGQSPEDMVTGLHPLQPNQTAFVA